MDLQNLIEQIELMRVRIDKLETDLTVTNSIAYRTESDLRDISTFLDFNGGCPPITESGKLTWEVVEVQQRLNSIERKYVGRDIDNMVDI